MGCRSPTVAATEMQVESLESSNRKASKNGLRAVISIRVPAQRPPKSVRSLTNLCLISVALCLNSASVYTAAALETKHAFVAGAVPGRGKPVVGDLMIKYEDQISLLTYLV